MNPIDVRSKSQGSISTMSTDQRTSESVQKLSRLYEWVRKFVAPEAALHWVHTTDAFALREIVEDGALMPQMCPVFGRELTYLFYGRPAYRFKEKGNLVSSFKSPVVIAFNDRVMEHAFRLYPFDSGAYHGGRYTSYLHPKMTLDSFEYPTNTCAEGRHVGAFYGDNSRYWDGEGLDLMHIAGEFEVEVVLRMMQDAASQSADDRRLAIELSVDAPIPITSEYVKAIFLPSALMDAQQIRAFLDLTGVIAFPYRANRHKPAIEYQALLENELAEFHESLGAL